MPRKPPITGVDALRVSARTCVPRDDCLARWEGLRSPNAAHIEIFDVIGEDFYGGVSARSVAAALREVPRGENVIVDVNSPGGDVFEGIAIHNVLAAHDGDVTVRVLGLAASAASVVAMAADRVEMANSAFLMIHNAWGIVVGDRNDLLASATRLEKIDRAMAAVYAARTGDDTEKLSAEMDAETWFNADDALARGFADALIETSPARDDSNARHAAVKAQRIVETAVIAAHPNMSRRERRALLAELKGAGSDATPSAATPRAGDFTALEGLARLFQPES